MAFTTASEPLLIRAENVGLSFLDRSHVSASWRDLFVNHGFILKNPDSSAVVQVLNQISFDAKQGERIAFIGRNGGGKSTLCNCIAGFFKPQKGQLAVNGRVRLLADLSVGIFPELTGRENTHILTRLMFDEKEENWQERAEEAMEFSELGDHLNRPYKTYSQGMKARLYLSLASRQRTDILIFDEVFDGTDAVFQKKLQKRLTDLIDNCGVTIMVSHSVEQLRSVCHRGLVLEQGRLVFDGPINAALDFYAGTTSK